MSPRTAEKYSEMRQSARSRIMDAALEIFAQEGYHPASISKIARKAGVSKGLMYNYFESKEELLKAIIFSGIESLSVGFDPNRDGVLTRGEMVHFIRESFRMVKDHPTYWKLYFLVVYQSPAVQLFQDELRGVLNNYLKMMERYFSDLKFENPYVEARLFMSMLDGVCINFLHSPEGFPIDEIKEKIVKMYS
jgi:AcrR family transcriptional regulator